MTFLLKYLFILHYSSSQKFIFWKTKYLPWSVVWFPYFVFIYNLFFKMLFKETFLHYLLVSNLFILFKNLRCSENIRLGGNQNVNVTKLNRDIQLKSGKYWNKKVKNHKQTSFSAISIIFLGSYQTVEFFWNSEWTSCITAINPIIFINGYQQ